jgi:hypothetical protein
MGLLLIKAGKQPILQFFDEFDLLEVIGHHHSRQLLFKLDVLMSIFLLIRVIWVALLYQCPSPWSVDQLIPVIIMDLGVLVVEENKVFSQSFLLRG